MFSLLAMLVIIIAIKKRNFYFFRHVYSLNNSIGTPGRIRTCDLWLRKPTLYPAELRVQMSEEEGKLAFLLLANAAPESVFRRRRKTITGVTLRKMLKLRTARRQNPRAPVHSFTPHTSSNHLVWTSLEAVRLSPKNL